MPGFRRFSQVTEYQCKGGPSAVARRQKTVICRLADSRRRPDSLRSIVFRMTTPLTPSPRDVLIRPLAHAGGVYAVQRTNAPDQVIWRSRRAAVAQSLAVARRERVRVWLTDAARAALLLADFAGTCGEASTTSDWTLLFASSANVLVTGPCADVWESLEVLTPFLADPVVEWSAGRMLPGIEAATGTVLIRDVDQLPLVAQHELADWLDAQGLERAQIVTTTSAPLYDLVVVDLFLDALYYRLNTVRLTAQCPVVASALV
jgi:sigma-54-interacting transcriptional regulator